MPIEVVKHKELHTEGDCGGEIEVRIDKKKRRVTTVCLRCRVGSVIDNGSIIADGVKIDESGNPADG